VITSIEIRDESAADLDAIREVNRQAFGQDLEGRIVDALREAGAVSLSLVAVVDDTIVGHILFSPLTVGTLMGTGLGPMAVLPSDQRQGVGSRLVEHGLQRLRALGCPFVVVLGHPQFYPRFGFQPAGAYGLTCEWDVDPDAFMVAVLDPQIAAGLRGRAHYRPEFSTIE
jgi:putative acetyltransferase